MNTEERKRKRRCEFQCKDHIFLLQTLKSNPSKYDIQIQFCPKYQRQPLPPQHTYPQFNNDFKYYTSAFILGVDRRILIKNEQQQIMDHQKQIRDSLEKHNQLIFPRPNSKHSLCSVCKEHYKNYYIHIDSQEHRERIGLSQYNNHIMELCNLYIDLWEGAEQRADQQAKMRALMEEQRKQRMAEQALLRIEQQSNELLDCQIGEPDGSEQKQYEQYIAKKNNARIQERQNQNNQDTVLINGKGSKRGRPDRSLYQPPIRKRYTAGHFNPTHAARQRKERQYERQRDKMMRGTLFEHFKKYFKQRPANQDDAFIVLEPIEGPAQPSSIQKPKQPKQTHSEKPAKKMANQKPKFQAYEEMQKQQNEFLRQEISENDQKYSFQDKKSQQIQQENREIKLQQMNRQSHQEGQLSNSLSSSSSRSSQKDNLTVRKQSIAQKNQNRPEWKIDPRMHNYSYPYAHMPNYASQYQSKHMQSIPSNNSESYKQAYKANSQYSEHYKNLPEGYKGMPPYFYNPYSYPVYDPHYMRPNQKDFKKNVLQKQKGKNPDNKYEYSNQMPYHWPYSPYYMQSPIHSQHGQKPQHPQTPNQHSSHLAPQPQTYSSPRSQGNLCTNININFPMCMCPPPHPNMPAMSYPPVPNSRYPPMHSMMNPYLGYQYNKYVNQQQRNGREGQYQAQALYPPNQNNPKNTYSQAQNPYQDNLSYSQTNSNHPSTNQPGKAPVSHPYYYNNPYSYHQNQTGQQQSKNLQNNKQP